MGVVDDATAILHLLAGFEQTPGDTKRGRYALEGKDIAEKVQLDAERINDAVNVLEENGHVEVERYLGTAPYDFGYVELTARGRVEAEHLAMQQAGADAPMLSATVAPIATSITPVGSPFGFTDEDWEAVALDRNAKDALIVVFGYQWKSDSTTPTNYGSTCARCSMPPSSGCCRKDGSVALRSNSARCKPATAPMSSTPSPETLSAQTWQCSTQAT